MKKKFTFSELLIISAVILTMTALITPVLANSRGQGRTLSCSGNLAAIGKATALYVNEFGAFPRRGMKPERKFGCNPAMSWVTLTVPYMGIKLAKPNIIPKDIFIREFVCPEDVAPAVPDDILYGQGGCSYITNNTFTAGGRTQGGIAYGMEINRIKRPAEKFYVFDAAGIRDFITAVGPFSHNRIGYRHRFAGTGNGFINKWQEKLSGGVNVLFADGHTGNQSGRALTCKDVNDVQYKNWGAR